MKRKEILKLGYYIGVYLYYFMFMCYSISIEVISCEIKLFFGVCFFVFNVVFEYINLFFVCFNKSSNL